ncbi:hypothetical protein [Rhizobiales bacterium 3FA27D7]|jgi:hypothetical protein|uniref:hypothetical protein n=1 Tax=Mesorhizobium sp. 2RAF21 TaxID=3232995 RepID=UPI0010F85233
MPDGSRAEAWRHDSDVDASGDQEERSKEIILFFSIVVLFSHEKSAASEFTPFRPAASLGLKAVLKGTWCAPGIRENVGAGLAALTVAVSGDEP